MIITKAKITLQNDFRLHYEYIVGRSEAQIREYAIKEARNYGCSYNIEFGIARPKNLRWNETAKNII
jgi:hypothetical protein